MMRSIYPEFIAFLVLIIQVVNGKKCNIADLIDEQCTKNETCEQITDSEEGICKCLKGFDRLSEKICINVTKPVRSIPSSLSYGDEDGKSNVAAAILVPLLLIVVLVVAYYSRKYRLLLWIRMKINQRNVNYDEVMIGQDLDDDEPPLH